MFIFLSTQNFSLVYACTIMQNLTFFRPSLHLYRKPARQLSLFSFYSTLTTKTKLNIVFHFAAGNKGYNLF